MTSLTRTLCMMFAVAILAATNLHGVTQSQHTLAHVADWPAVSLIGTNDDHDHHGPHIHVAPDTESDSDFDGERPVGHHHHGGGDSQGALPTVSRSLTDTPRLVSALGEPGSGPPMSGLTGDGPEYPPKRMRTVV